MFSIDRFKNHDYIITIICFLLGIISMLLIYSTTYNADTAEGGVGTFRKQLLIFIIGFGIYFAISLFDLSWLKNRQILIVIYFITIASLIYVKFFTPEIQNTNRWINLLGFGIQPAEYAKITLIIITAALLGIKEDDFAKTPDLQRKKSSTNENQKRYLAQKLRKFNTYRNLLSQNSRSIYSFLLIIPIITLVFVQPSFGNSVIISLLWAGVVFASNPAQLKVINFFLAPLIIVIFAWEIISPPSFIQEMTSFKILDINILILSLIILITIMFSFKSKLALQLVFLSILIALVIKPITLEIWESDLLSNYQKERIEVYLKSPEDDPLDAGYQVKQSKIAIGAGQLDGRGYLKGTQSTLKVLPYAHTDFIFASLAEQFGMVGGLLLMILYIALIFRILSTANATSDEFAFLIAIGVSAMILINIFINIGMNMGKLPVTGVPLPLISYGGSSVLVNLIGLGLIQSIRTNLKLKDISESFTPGSNVWK